MNSPEEKSGEKGEENSGDGEARCGDICQGCRGSKFCGFMDRKKTPKKDLITADRVEDRLDMMRRRSS